MNKKFKISIFGVFFLIMVFFLMVCDMNMNFSDYIEILLSYILMFDIDGGLNIDIVIFKVGDKIELELILLIKDGYIFIGWELSMLIIMLVYYVILKVIWELNSYLIIFDIEGGSSIDLLIFFYLEGLFEIKVLIKEGYIFGGWDIILLDIMLLNGFNVKVIWIKVFYIVIFDIDGGSKIDFIVLVYEENIYVLLEFIKLGYIFIGWDKEFLDIMFVYDVYFKVVWERIIFDFNDIFRENFELF